VGGLPTGNEQRTLLQTDRDGSPVLEQLPSRLGTIPGGIGMGLRCQQVIGNRRLQLPDILDMFPTMASSQHRFISTNTLGESTP